MALVLADRVRDTTTTTGTGTVTLSGTSPTGYQTFGAAIGNGNTTYYTINAGSQWEVGLGTYSSTGPTLARTTVLASSNSDSLVDFSTGTKDVFVTYPAEKSVNQDANGNVGIGTTSPTRKLSVVGAGNTYINVNSGNDTSVAGILFGGTTSPSNGQVVYDNSANSMTFVVGGSGRAVINSSGNVGIGTSSPTGKLDVNGKVVLTGGEDNQLQWTNNSQTWRLNNSSAGQIYLYNVTSTRFPFKVDAATASDTLCLTSTGVGIGTSSPGSKLDVVAQDAIRITGFQPFQTWRDSSDSNKGFRIQTAGGATLFSNDSTGGGTYTERMRIAADGTMTLSIGGVSNTHQFNYNESGGEIQLIDSTGAGPILIDNVSGLARFYKVGTGAISMGTTGANYFQFITNGSERMRIDVNGLVGIGTSAPNHTLDVAGNVGISSNIYMGQGLNNGNSIEIGYGRTGSNFAYIDLIGDTTYSDYGFRILRGNGGANTDSRLQHRGTGALTLLTEEAAPITFNTSATERMRIDSSGLVLIGTTATVGGTWSNEVKRTDSGVWPWGLNCVDRGLIVRNSAAGSGFYAYFEYNGGTNNGSISWSGGTTAYNTTSDYRLKNINGPLTNSGAYIDALNPVEGSWKADGKRFIGLLAHQVQEVSQTAVVVGEKDGAEMQQMDYSAPELIANLIAEVQSLRARVAQLEGK